MITTTRQKISYYCRFTTIHSSPLLSQQWQHSLTKRIRHNNVRTIVKQDYISTTTTAIRTDEDAKQRQLSSLSSSFIMNQRIPNPGTLIRFPHINLKSKLVESINNKVYCSPRLQDDINNNVTDRLLSVYIIINLRRLLFS